MRITTCICRQSLPKITSSSPNRLDDVGKVHAVVCTAGGWVGETLRAADLYEHIDRMHRINLRRRDCKRAIGAVLAPGGLVVLTGANAALFGTPEMVAYGLSKAATHQLVLTLSGQVPARRRHRGGSDAVCAGHAGQPRRYAAGRAR